jgi:hypothetical protein
MIFTAAFWLATMMQGQTKTHCIMREPLPLACICQPPGVAFNREKQCFPLRILPDGQSVLLLGCVNPTPWYGPLQTCVLTTPVNSSNSGKVEPKGWLENPESGSTEVH